MRHLRHLLLPLAVFVCASTARGSVPILPAPKKVVETDENGIRRFHAIRLETDENPAPYQAIIAE
ncbi:MAG: hypothetical protein K2G58_07050, partial [Alistipes sp.]|nr:hypothetical protein [Alistipes sp.]